MTQLTAQDFVCFVRSVFVVALRALRVRREAPFVTLAPTPSRRVVHAGGFSVFLRKYRENPGG